MEFVLKKKILQHSGPLYAVNYLPSKNLLLTGGSDKIVASWDLNTFENTPFSIKTDSAILSLNPIMNDQYLLIGLFNGNFHVVDIESKKEVKFIPFHKSGLFTSQYIKSKNLLVLGSGDGTYSIWNTNDFSLLNKGKLSYGKIRTIVYENEHIYIGTSEGMIISIHSTSFEVKIVHQLDNNGINALCYLPQKNVWLCGTKNAHIHAIDFESGKEIFNFPAHNWPIYKIVNIDDWGIASCSRDKTIKIWDANSLDLIQRMEFRPHKAHTHSINNMIYDPENSLLISVSDDKSICFWEHK